MIYDVLIYNGEAEVLKIHLQELWPVVDRFVIVEATRSFKGHPKPAYFREQKQDFTQYLPKIWHHVVTDMPDADDPWCREHWQREAARSFLSMLRADDTVILADADEVPMASAVAAYRHEMGLSALQGHTYNYYLNLIRLDNDKDRPWLVDQPRIFPGNLLLQKTAYSIRFAWPDYRVIPDSSWHFSYMGGPELIRRKLMDFSHSVDIGADQMLNDLNAGVNHVIRDREWLRVVPIDGHYPACVQANLGHYLQAGYVWPRATI